MKPSFSFLRWASLTLGMCILSLSWARADILVTGRAGGFPGVSVIDRYDENTLQYLGRVFTAPTNDLKGIDFGPDGKIYLSEHGAIVRLLPDGTLDPSLPPWPAFNLASGLFGANGSAPGSLTFDPAGNLYADNPGYGYIDEYDATGHHLARIYYGFNSPGQITFGPDGYLYLTSLDYKNIFRLLPDGSNESIVLPSTFNERPNGVDFAPNGDLYFSTSAGNLWRWNASTGVSLFATLPNAGNPDLSGVPWSIRFDHGGNLIVGTYVDAYFYRYHPDATYDTFTLPQTGVYSYGAWVTISPAAPTPSTLPYTLTQMATLGHNNTYANAINNNGGIVGFVQENSTTPAMATYWDSTGAANGLGTLPGGSFSKAYAISANGRIVGIGDNGTTNVAFSGGLIGSLFDMGGARASIAQGINDTWGVVGQATFSGSSSAFVHGSGSSQIVTDDNLGGAPVSSALGINNSGQIIGWGLTGTNSFLALLWNPNGTGQAGSAGWNWTDLGSLGGGSAQGFAINDLGQTVGQSTVSGAAVYHAFLWTPGGVSGPSSNPQMQDLGTLEVDSQANAVNLFGQVVGFNVDASGNSSAFVWDSVNQMKDLNSLLDPVTGSGWVLQVANGINDKGQIVGYGSYGGVTRAFVLTPPAALYGLTVTPADVTGGTTVTGTITLTSAAPSGGLTVTLSSDTPSVAAVPATVTVPAGQTSVNFTITTTTLSTDTDVTLNATHGNDVPQSALLTVQTLRHVTALTLSPTTVLGGASSTATITLDNAAPSGGLSVALSSDNSNAQVPSSVTVTEGATSASFSVTTSQTQTTQTAHISGALNGTVTAALTVRAPSVTGVSLNPTSVTGGSASTGTVTLSDPAPSAGFVVSLSSDQTVATVPSSVTVAAGQTTATIPVSTTAVATNTTANITATANSSSASATLTVNAPVLSSLSLNLTTVAAGASSTGTLTLSSVAPTGGLNVTLSSSNPSAATVPANVTVPAGSTTATFTVSSKGVSSDTTSTLTAAYNTSTASATLTVKAAVLLGVTCSPNYTKGGTTVRILVSLYGVAAPGGAIVSLVSNNSSKLPLPSSVTIPAGSSSVIVSVVSKTVTSNTTITATATYLGVSKSAIVTLTP